MKKLHLVILLLIYPLVVFAQQRDQRVREYREPVRIVWQQLPDSVSGSEFLLVPGNGQSDLANTRICVMKSSADEFPALLLDFGKELQGGLQFVTGMPASKEPVTIRVRLGESVSEAMAEPDAMNGACNDHAMRDFIIRLPWLGVLETGNSGFRFARIDLLEPERELHLKEVRAIASFRDIPYTGSFR